MATPNALVSGCFDLLHAGHIAFLREAATRGELHVAVGSDRNLDLLKGKPPMYTVDERVYMLNALEFVTDAFPAGGSGLLDFEPDLERLNPDVFVVNEDGNHESKRNLCARHGVEYVVLKRTPPDCLPARSSSAIKRELARSSAARFPYRLALVGGWIDQPWVSSVHPGSMVVAQLEPTIAFSDRSGMATSTRKTALRMWPNGTPDESPEKLARLMFGAENPPGTEYVSGSQDALGLMLPGINELHYAGGYWPDKIESIQSPDAAQWLERVLHLVPIAPRADGYDPLTGRHADPDAIGLLARTGSMCMEAIRTRDVTLLGRALNDTLEAWKRILPNTVPPEVDEVIRMHDHHPGCLPSGCGGGYLIVVSEEHVRDGLKVSVRL